MLQGPDTAMTDRVHEESAAGPEAQAAAEAAMQAFEQQGGRGRPPRSLEDMMEAIMEQGYQEGMQVGSSTLVLMHESS